MRYETMLIVDSAKARADQSAVETTITSIIEKCSGSNIDIEKYGERKLAYTVGKHTRGAYYLVHFDMPGLEVAKLRREFKLSEDIFRYMVQMDHDSAEERRDLATPKSFNVDSIDSRNYFERYDSGKASESAKSPEPNVEVEKTVSTVVSDEGADA